MISKMPLVEAYDPVRLAIKIVAAGNHVPVVGAKPVSSVSAPAGRQNRRTVLGRDSNNLRSIAVGNSQLVAHARTEQTPWAVSFLARPAAKFDGAVIGHGLNFSSGIALVPLIGDDAGLRRPGPGHENGMARRGKGRHMIEFSFGPLSALAYYAANAGRAEYITEARQIYLA